METKTLIQTAQDKQFTEFDAAAKEILARKVAEKLADRGYFAKLDQAKGIFSEDCDSKGPKGKGPGREDYDEDEEEE
jgi:hypothetical protein